MKKLEQRISNLEKELDKINKIKEKEIKKLKLEKEIIQAEMKYTRELDKILNPKILPLYHNPYFIID